MTTLRLKKDKDTPKDAYRALAELVCARFGADSAEPAALTEFLEEKWRVQDETQRQSEALRQAEGEKLKERIPEFDLGTELKDPLFEALLRTGVPLETAYRAVHLEELAAKAAESAKEELQRRITEDIRIRGLRVPENGIYANCGVSLSRDVSALSREQRADYARRAARGEKITLTR